MVHPYWEQFDKEELNEMHGIEDSDEDISFIEEESKYDAREDQILTDDISEMLSWGSL